MNDFIKIIMLSVVVLLSGSMSFGALAAPVVVTLSQEQDGGPQGRACMYIHHGKAEYRIVKAGELCPATVTLDPGSTSTHTADRT